MIQVGDAEGLISESSCSISCANGYRIDSFETVKATCSGLGEEFKFFGCYAEESFSESVPNFIASSGSYLHFSADSGLTVDGNGKVTSWVSKKNFGGNQITLTPTDVTKMPTLAEDNAFLGNKKSVRFTRDSRPLTSDEFFGLKNKENLTKVIVATTNNNTDSMTAVSDRFSGGTLKLNGDGFLYDRANRRLGGGVLGEARTNFSGSVLFIILF